MFDHGFPGVEFVMIQEVVRMAGFLCLKNRIHILKSGIYVEINVVPS